MIKKFKNYTCVDLDNVRLGIATVPPTPIIIAALCCCI